MRVGGLVTSEGKMVITINKDYKGYVDGRINISDGRSHYLMVLLRSGKR